MSDAVPAGWEGILDPGERILWQGRPSAAFTFRGQSVALMLGGALFAGVALLFIGVGIALREWAFALFPVIHLAVGLGMILGGPILSARERGRTWYTLTDRRAVIATDNWPKGRQIRTWPIGRDTPLELVEGRWPAVHFAYEQRAGKKGLYKAPVGFEMLPEARAVHDIILQNRQGA